MAAPKAYRYVGPKDIAERARPDFIIVRSPEDVRTWIRRTGQRGGAAGCIIATFVIDLEYRLRLADRHSEHVACAEGRPVLSAGEMALEVDSAVRAAWCSNQSIGYCPEPSSWPAVAAALARAGIPGPDGFDPALEFRRCPACGMANIVKESAPECGACGGSLPERWNLDASEAGWH